MNFKKADSVFLSLSVARKIPFRRRDDFVGEGAEAKEKVEVVAAIMKSLSSKIF